MTTLVASILILVACAPANRPVVATPPVPRPTVELPRARTVITESSIEVYETIQFVGNTVQIAPGSTPILDAIAQTMQGNPSITLLEVRGHSDWEEPDRRRRAELSIERAENVVAALVARGVEPARLTAYGASDSEPLSVSDPVVNRRIELFILERNGLRGSHGADRAP